jgi:deoxyribonuclease V
MMRGVWPASSEQLIAYQHELALARPAPWRPAPTAPAIGACVVVFARGYTGPGAPGDHAWAAAAVLRDGHAEAEAGIIGAAGAAYAPGLLALREGPCLEAAVRALRVWPDVLLVDGTGRDHPRRAGLAIHLGAVLDLPTVGVTHRPLLATGPWPEDREGAASAFRLDGEVVGMWLRTRVGARPLAVHGAWRTSLDTAVDIVGQASGGHRTPEPLRHARRLARTARAT